MDIAVGKGTESLELRYRHLKPDIGVGVARGDPSPTLGFLFGFPIGVTLEMKYINFSTDVSFGTKILRALMGFSLLAGLMIILPLLGLGGTYYLRFIRSATISFAGAFLLPYSLRQSRGDVMAQYTPLERFLAAARRHYRNFEPFSPLPRATL